MTSALSLPALRFSNWSNLDAHLVWIYEGYPRIDAASTSPACFTAWQVERGRVEVGMGQQYRQIGLGEWVILPPGRSDRRFSSRARILSLHFDVRWVTGRRLFNFESPLVFSPRETKKWRSLAYPMLTLVDRYFPQVYNHLPEVEVDFAIYKELQGHFHQWLALLWQGVAQRGVPAYLPNLKDPRILEMKRWMDAHPLQEAFRLDTLAKASSLSAGQVNRLFCAEFDMTPKRYFEHKRLAYARAELASTSRPVKEISFSVGFRYLSEFSAWFRKHSGESPRKFRETVK